MQLPSALRPSRGHRHWLALLLYTLLAAALTWPLLAHFTTHLAGDGIDDPSLAWNLWWLKARLVDQLNPDFFHVGWMFHPIGINLAFYTLTPLNGLLSVSLQTAASLVVAANVLLLASFALAGFGAYLLTYDQLRVACCVTRGADIASNSSKHATRNTQHHLFRRSSICRCDLCLCLVQALLCRPGPVQYCQQPVDSLLRLVSAAHDPRPDDPPRPARGGVGRSLSRLPGLGRTDLCDIFVDLRLRPFRVAPVFTTR